MFNTKKINEDTVAVIWSGADNPSIDLRHSGKEFYRTEKPLVYFQNNGTELVIDRATADEFGVDIVLIN